MNMKNYLVLGEKWVRAMVFADEADANDYTEKNCAHIPYQRYSEAEFKRIYVNSGKHRLEYKNDYRQAVPLIIIH